MTDLRGKKRVIDGGIDSSLQIKAGDTPSIDAFGRWRVSNPETLFDSKQIFDNQPLYWDDQEVSGSGTSSNHSVNRASTTLAVSATTAGKRVRQTFMRFNYQPGKSQLVLMTGVLGSQGTDIAARMGLFDDNNGIFLVNTAGTTGVAIRSKVTGSVVDNLVAQSNWNLDTMDGTGPSGITLDWDNAQIFLVDFEWLGVGRVRVGFVVDGNIYYCHQFNHANNISSVYMSTPNLPLRYEIEAGGTNPNTGSLEHICSSVISEGGLQKNGTLEHIDSNKVSYTTAETAYIVLAGRLKTGYFGLSVDIENVSASIFSNDFGKWEFRAGGTPSETLTYTGVTNSGVEVFKGDGSQTLTGGQLIDGRWITAASAVDFTTPNAVRLGSTIDGTPQVFYLVFIPNTNNTSFAASVTWREIL